jgi:hypothetical protein
MVKEKGVLKRYSIKVGLALFALDGSLPKVQTKIVFRLFDSS